MLEKVIVKVYDGKKKIKQNEFMIYESALRYAKQQVDSGFSCQILRQDDGKTWCKINMYPSETM